MCIFLSHLNNFRFDFDLAYFKFELILKLVNEWMKMINFENGCMKDGNDWINKNEWMRAY